MISEVAKLLILYLILGYESLVLVEMMNLFKVGWVFSSFLSCKRREKFMFSDTDNIKLTKTIKDKSMNKSDLNPPSRLDAKSQ